MSPGENKGDKHFLCWDMFIPYLQEIFVAISLSSQDLPLNELVLW